MALKALRIRRSIDSKNELLHQLMEKDESFRTRETELEAAIMEAKTDDDLATVDQEVEKFEAENSCTRREIQSPERKEGQYESEGYQDSLSPDAGESV